MCRYDPPLWEREIWRERDKLNRPTEKETRRLLKKLLKRLQKEEGRTSSKKSK